MGMTDEEIKQTLEGFTQAMRTMWGNPNLTIPKDLAEKYNVVDKFRDKKISELEGKDGNDN